MGKVYFGNTTKQSWVVAPQSGLKADSIGWSKETQLLDGRAFVKRSKASHRKFDMSWLGAMNETDLETSLNTIKEFADGHYGDGPFYWLDPFATATNIMPPNWATPALSETGWKDIAPGLAKTYVPEAVAHNYPIKYVEFDTANGYQSAEEFIVIIPKNYSLNFGWHGPAGSSTSGVRITPVLRADGYDDTPLNPARIDAGSLTKTNTKVKGDTYSHVRICVATTTAATVKITSMFAQVLPEDSSVAAGDFFTGRGTTSLEFANSPAIEYYSSAIGNGRIGMSATLIEV